jgi:hypothetical protein
MFAVLTTENATLRTDLRNARAARDEALALLNELRAAVRARHAAEDDVRRLHRERDIARAQAAVRDPAALMH